MPALGPDCNRMGLSSLRPPAPHPNPCLQRVRVLLGRIRWLAFPMHVVPVQMTGGLGGVAKNAGQTALAQTLAAYLVV